MIKFYFFLLLCSVRHLLSVRSVLKFYLELQTDIGDQMSLNEVLKRGSEKLGVSQTLYEVSLLLERGILRRTSMRVSIKEHSAQMLSDKPLDLALYTAVVAGPPFEGLHPDVMPQMLKLFHAARGLDRVERSTLQLATASGGEVSIVIDNDMVDTGLKFKVGFPTTSLSLYRTSLMPTFALSAAAAR